MKDSEEAFPCFQFKDQSKREEELNRGINRRSEEQTFSICLCKRERVDK
jgi:hypothetical protein